MDDAKLLQRAVTEWGLSPEAAERMLSRLSIRSAAITLVKLNVVLAGGPGFESDGVAHHECNSFGFGFSLAL